MLLFQQDLSVTTHLMHRGTGSLLCLSFSFESLQGAFADDSSKGDAEHCLGLSIPLSYTSPGTHQPCPGCGSASSCAWAGWQLCSPASTARPAAACSVPAGMRALWGFSSQKTLCRTLFSHVLEAAAAPLLPKAPTTLLWPGPGTIPCLPPSLGDTSEPCPELVLRHSQNLPHPELYLDVQTSSRCL